MPDEVSTINGLSPSLAVRLQAASDVYSPVSGEVVETNTELTADPSKARRLSVLAETLLLLLQL
jgi:Glycine cleavage H-protein